MGRLLLPNECCGIWDLHREDPMWESPTRMTVPQGQRGPEQTILLPLQRSKQRKQNKSRQKEGTKCVFFSQKPSPPKSSPKPWS